jgi:hypothetical protein
VQFFQPSQKFECPPFCHGWSHEIKNYGAEITFNGMTSLLIFMKIYQLVENLLVEDGRPLVTHVAYPQGKTRQTDMGGPIRCSSLMPEREKQLKSK